MVYCRSKQPTAPHNQVAHILLCEALAKLLNTSTALNTSQERLLETQQLLHSMTEDDDTASVPSMDSLSLIMRLITLPSTFSFNEVLCAISTARRRCISVMLQRDSLTPKCPLKNSQGQNSFRGSWTPPRNGCRRRWRRRKGQTPSANSATFLFLSSDCSFAYQITCDHMSYALPLHMEVPDAGEMHHSSVALPTCL